MTFLCHCKTCDLEEWLSGSDDPDTNSCEITGELSCGHEEYEVVDFEYPERLDDDVI